MAGFLEALTETETHCTCGHHEGSHCHGFSNQACMWCECRSFVDPENLAARRPAGAPPPRRVLNRLR